MISLILCVVCLRDGIAKVHNTALTNFNKIMAAVFILIVIIYTICTYILCMVEDSGRGLNLNTNQNFTHRCYIGLRVEGTVLFKRALILALCGQNIAQNSALLKKGVILPMIFWLRWL